MLSLSASLLVLSILKLTTGYNITCLTIDFDCADIPGTMNQICSVFNTPRDTEPSYIPRGRRSVTSSSEQEDPSDMMFTYSPQIKDESITQESSMIHRSNRHRRSLGIVDRCCQPDPAPRCNFDDVTSYCREYYSEINSCEE
nr:insulin-like androgenic gland hormone [Hippolyte inermis]